MWEEEKMELLFDTLLKGDSFGGIMVIEEEKDSKPLFNFRPFTRDGKPISSKEVNKLNQLQFFVIDGQQRLQTFYIGLKGSFNGKDLYFDLYSDYKSEFEFKFENDSSKLAKQTKDNSERPVPEHNWYPAKNLLKRLKDTNDEDQVAQEIILRQNIDDDLKKNHVSKNVKAFYKNVVQAETLGISRVAVNKTLEEGGNKQRIVELFRRLNDGGTKLSPFDLVASILKGYAWEMEAFLEKTLEDFKDIGLTQDNLIKLVFLLRDNHSKEMTEIDADDSNFAIANKNRILASLTAVRKFLVASDLYNYYKEGNRSFIPLFFIAYHIFYKQITDDQVEKFFDNYDANNPDYNGMKKWIYYSLINGVFRSKGAGWIPYRTGIRKLLSVIKDHKSKLFPVKGLFDVYYSHGVTFTEIFDASKLDVLESQFLFYLMYGRKQVIRVQDIDHIMPKSLLEGRFDWQKINSIANFQLLDSGTNRVEKNAKPFKSWINKWVSDKVAFVTKHLIPADENFWNETDFDQFVQQRSILILDKINSYIPGSTAKIGANTSSSTPSNMTTAIRVK